ncbi:hypothetical protein HDU96_001003 [Phlyctochytrium bullatum]|nr:hypothetical protein HDU96_001003 [Phlyctochytrium bullatum]
MADGTLQGGVSKKARKPVTAKATACDSCYRLKRRCDTKLPICSLCKRTGNECTYIRRFISPSLIQRKQRSEKEDEEYKRALEQRLESMERTVRSLLMGMSGGSVMPSPSSGAGGALHSPNQFFAGPAEPNLPSPQPTPLTANSTQRPGTFADNLELAYRPYEMYPPGMDVPAPFAAEDEQLLAQAFPLYNASPRSGYGSSPTPASGASPGNTSSASPSPALVNQSSCPDNASAQDGNDSVNNAWIDMVEAAFSNIHLHSQRLSTPEDPGVDDNDDVSESTDSPSDLAGHIGIQTFRTEGGRSKYFAGTVIVNKIPLTFAEGELEFYVDIFFELNMRMPLGFLHEGAIRADILSSPTGLSSCPALVFTMCSVASATGRVSDGSRWPMPGYAPSLDLQKSEEFFSAALAALDYDKPSVEMCQTLLILVVYTSFISTSKTSYGWLITGMATRLVPLLKLDVDPDVLEAQSKRRWTTLEKETRRRVFNFAVSVDMMSMIFKERSSRLWHSRLAVKPPSNIRLWRSIDAKTGEPTLDPASDEPDMTHHAVDLIHIMCRVVDYYVGRGSFMGNDLKVASFLLTAGNEADKAKGEESGSEVPRLKFEDLSGSVETEGEGVVTLTSALEQPFVHDWTCSDKSEKSPMPMPSDLLAASHDLTGPAPDLLEKIPWRYLGAPDEFDEDFVKLDNDLRTWRASLPEWMSSLEGYEVFTIGSNYFGENGIPNYILVKVFLYSEACTLTLHRPRMVHAVAEMVRYRADHHPGSSYTPNVHVSSELRSTISELIPHLPPTLNPLYLDSLRACSEASRAVTKFLRKRFRIVGPNPHGDNVMMPAAFHFGIGEARAILEAALHHLVVYTLLRDERGVFQASGRHALESFLETNPTLALEEVAVARRILVNISQKWPSVLFMVQMLDRLATEVGISELPEIAVEIWGDEEHPKPRV